MALDTYTCHGPLCDGAHWTVERADEAAELWAISASPDDPGFLVAVPEPICPRCAERLLPALSMMKGGQSHVRHAA